MTSLVSLSELQTNTWELVLLREDKANALNESLVYEIHDGIRQLVEKQARAVIIRSSGKVFCSGFDFSGHRTLSSADLLQRFVAIELMLQELRYAPFVSMAYVAGAAFGAGADLALACTWRIGSPASQFRFPGFQFGLALGTRHLGRVVGHQKARDILLLNQVLAASEAREVGLLTELLDVGEFNNHRESILDQLGNLDNETIERITRLTSNDTRHEDLSELVRSLTYGDLHARVESYLEKSKLAGKN